MLNSKPFLGQVAEDLLKRFGDGLQDAAIVFNNRRPIVFLKKELTALTGKPLWSPSFYTVQEFFRLSAVYPEASTLTQFFILHKLHNLLLKEQGQPEENVDEFYPLAEIILADFAQLDFELVDPEAVYAELYDIALLQQRFPHLTADQQYFMKQFWDSFSAGKQTAMQEKFLRLWGRLPKLYRLFRQQLEIEKLTYTAGVYRDLALGLAAKPNFSDSYQRLIFVGFNALNACEATLFSTWQAEGKALFYFDADSYYLDDEQQEAGLFLRRNIYRYNLKNALGDFPAELGNRKNMITLIETTGRVAQAKLLARLLKDPVKEGSSTKTAILLADENLLIPVLQSLPAEGDVFNVTMGYPLIQSTLFGLIDLWLIIQQYLYENKGAAVFYRDVESFLSHPLSDVEPGEQARLQQLISENEWLDVPVEVLMPVGGIFPYFFVPVKLGNLIPVQLGYVLNEIISRQEHRGALMHMETALILAVKKTLNQLQQGIAVYPELSPVFVFSLLRKALQRITAPIEGEPLQGIQIMGLLESRCLDFEELYIVGANEGVLPKANTPPTFIPDAIRRAYNLPVMESQDALSAYPFYRLLQRAKHVTLIYNNQVDDTNTGEPSRFIRQLEFESKFTFQRKIQEQAIMTMPASGPLVIPKTGAVWQQLLRYLNADDPARPRLSASAFTTYLQSPLLFFLKYIARIKEPPRVSEEFEMNKLGSVIHRSMQVFYEELLTAGKYISRQQIQEKMRELPRICLQALSVESFSNPDRLNKPNSMQRILLKIAEEYATVFLNYDANEVAPFTIVELENANDYTINFSFNIMGKEKTVCLYGIIDRVDQRNGKTRIVDYKTGRDELKYHSLESLFAPASSKSNKAMIQALFYTYIYEELTRQKDVEPNLYVARRLRQEGPLFYSGSGIGSIPVQGNVLEEIKGGFEGFLKDVLEELFNPEVPFIHNADAVLYANDPYIEFLKTGRNNIFDEETGFVGV